MMKAQDIGRIISEKRKKLGISKKELANAVETYEMHIHSLEMGNSKAVNGFFLALEKLGLDFTITDNPNFVACTKIEQAKEWELKRSKAKDRLKEIIEKFFDSQREMAEKTGISYAVLSAIARGQGSKKGVKLITAFFEKQDKINISLLDGSEETLNKLLNLEI